MKVTTVLKNLFKQPDDPKKPRPIFIIGLGLVLVVFLLNMFLNKEEDASAPVVDAPKASIVDWVKDTIGLSSSPDEMATETEPTLPSIPNIPESALSVDQALIEGSQKVESNDFKMVEVTVQNEGRRDPMKSLEGENVGTFDKKRIDDKPSDTLDESKDYFGGIAIDDIIFDSMKESTEDNKVRGRFIIHGSIYEDLTVGDFLAELYYVKTYNQKNDYVVLQYQDKTFRLNAQNILSSHQGAKTPTYK